MDDGDCWGRGKGRGVIKVAIVSGGTASGVVSIQACAANSSDSRLSIFRGLRRLIVLDHSWIWLGNSISIHNDILSKWSRSYQMQVKYGA